MRKIVYVSGTRADYGLMRNTLKEIENDKNLDLEIIVTGMHLMKEFGYTADEIRKDKFKTHIINSKQNDSTKESMTKFIGNLIIELTDKFKEIKPDIILVLGDRGEMLAASIVGAYLSIPVAHIHGGEITSTIDEITRHTITKLSNIHLPATNKSADRIKKMGEENWRINVVGAPGLDSILNHKLLSKDETFRKLGLNIFKKTAIIIQHPVTGEEKYNYKYMKETLNAVKATNIQAVIIYPNADNGGKDIIKMIEEEKINKNFKIFKSIEHDLFLSMMKHADLMIGNSSSGIIESTSFKLPVINIGQRQGGRERAENVIDVNPKKILIEKEIIKALSPEFKLRIINIKNPYGDGKTGPRIAKILSDITIDKRLLQKRMTY